MASPYRVCISFSGLTIRFVFPEIIGLPDYLGDFLCADPGTVDEEFEIRLLTAPLVPGAPPVHTISGTQIYATDKGWLRIYSSFTAEDGCQVACLLCPDSKNVLYYPASQWDIYSKCLRFLPQLGGEVILLRHNALLLHSSVVMIHGKMVLFSGPSGAGKSTQADLWRSHLGADIINGDRCVIMKREDGFYGGGSPWCGTSGIHRREQAPIAGIFLVNQAPENKITRLGFGAFAPLFTQTLVNSWDPEFMSKATDLFSQLLDQVPVFRLDCRPDRDAAMLAYQILF